MTTSLFTTFWGSDKTDAIQGTDGDDLIHGYAQLPQSDSKHKHEDRATGNDPANDR